MRISVRSENGRYSSAALTAKAAPRPISWIRQEWGDGPELVERQNEGENLAEFLAQALVVKADGRQQVAAQRECRRRRSPSR